MGKESSRKVSVYEDTECLKFQVYRVSENINERDISQVDSIDAVWNLFR